MYLYLDTTFGTVIGLLDQNFEWLDYFENYDQKNASFLHQHIANLCLKNYIEINQLKGLILSAGPGGYTGLRVSDGISQTFSWFGYETYSFYHFEILSLMGVKKGLWLSNAFKGEFFCFNQELNQHSLKREAEWFINQPTDQYFTHYFQAFSPTSKTKFISSQFIETSILIKNNSRQIFRQIIGEKRKKELFYYRPIDQEFTKPVSPKI